VQFNAGSIAESAGALDEAETAYRRALALRPDLAEAAGNLAALLIRAGRPAEAIPPLRTALAERPSSEVCWNNLIVALLASGRGAEARVAADDARRNGVPPDPGLLEAIPAPAETPPPAGGTP